jgi:phenol hydroxylase P0 protein
MGSQDDGAASSGVGVDPSLPTASSQEGPWQDKPRQNEPLHKFVRVTGTRLDKYVEFEFSVNDADLTVELILPFTAFDEFCRLQNVTVLPPDSAASAKLEQLAWRSRQPGLLRRVKDGQTEEAPEANAPDSDRQG